MLATAGTILSTAEWMAMLAAAGIILSTVGTTSTTRMLEQPTHLKLTDSLFFLINTYLAFESTI